MTIDLRNVPATGGRVRINVAAGRDALTVLEINDASARLRRLALAGLRRGLGIGAYQHLPSADQGDWTGATPLELLGAIRGIAPGFTLLGLVVPRQAGRSHLMVVGRASGTLVIAKVDADHRATAHEAFVLDQLSRRPLPSIRTPRVVGVDRLQLGRADVTVMVTEVVSTMSAPAFGEELRRFEHHLRDRLGDLPHLPATPDHWVPAHRDLSPWNLRRTDRGLALYDWELTAYAPPGTDLAYYEACNAAMSRGPWPRVGNEVADHLIDMIDARNRTIHDRMPPGPVDGPLPAPTAGGTDAIIRAHLIPFGSRHGTSTAAAPVLR